MPLKTYCHLFHCCRGFNSVNKCFYCSRSCVQNKNIARYLDKKFTFKRSFFKDFVLESGGYYFIVVLYFHYEGSHFFLNNVESYQNFGVIFYKHVSSSFHLPQFYLGIFSRVLFDNLNKKILPPFLKK